MSSQKSRITQGISFEPELLPVAKAQAAKKRQSFSAYVNGLIAADLGCELPATEPEKSPQPRDLRQPAAA